MLIGCQASGGKRQDDQGPNRAVDDPSLFDVVHRGWGGSRFGRFPERSCIALLTDGGADSVVTGLSKTCFHA
jgi:hypothetical protein